MVGVDGEGVAADQLGFARLVEVAIHLGLGDCFVKCSWKWILSSEDEFHRHHDLAAVLDFGK
jgi:hypothetical protein